MNPESTADTNTGALPTLEEKKSRRGLLALIGAGGAAAVAAALGRDSTAHAAHDGTNVLHVGALNTALPGSATRLAGNVDDVALAAFNPNPGELPVGVGGIASTSVVAMSGQGGVAEGLRERLRAMRFFIRNAGAAASADGGVGAQGVAGNGIGVFGGGDLAGVEGDGFVGVAGFGSFGIFGLGTVGVLGGSDTSDLGSPGVAAARAAGPGVLGASGASPGVFGVSNTGAGVRGEGRTGVSGTSSTGAGVRGVGRTGVRGHASGVGKVGVHASAANRAVALKVEGGALLLPRLTRAQRNALSAVNGMLIYNTTVNRVQARVAGRWVNL